MESQSHLGWPRPLRSSLPLHSHLCWRGCLTQICASVGCLFLVHLVQFHDAPWTLSPGAAVNAAEAEAAARTRHHEPAALRQRWQPFASEGSINHGMLGLQDWPTRSCAGGSPLFCSLLSGGRKCSTDPLSVHKTSAVRGKPTPGTLPSLGPLEGERNCCLAHSVTWYHRLSPSPSCMSLATWEAKAENEGQMGEANENFSNLFSSLWGRQNRNPLMIALLTENVVEITPKHLYYYLSSKITLNSSVHRRAS